MERFDDLFSAAHSATVTDVAVLVHEVRLRIGVLSQRVTVRIYYDGKGNDPYSFELSARMKTDTESEPCDTSCRAPSETEALRRAARMLTQDYESAVRRGELPDDGWLVRS